MEAFVIAAAASVGIIGGADGPTSVFITSSPLSGLGAYMLAVLVAAAVDAVLIHRRNRR